MSNSSISKNSLANIIGMLGQIVIAFVLSPFLVHTLGDTKYGIWTIAVAFTGYMNLLDFGLTSAVNKFVSKYKSLNDQKSINSIVSTSFVLFFTMGVIIVMLSPLMADFIISFVNIDAELVDVVHLLIIIVSFDICIFVISGLFKGIFGGYQKYSVINYTQIISALYKAIMFYFFLSNGYGLVAMGLISITANILAVVIFFFWLLKTFPEVKFKINLVRREKASQIINFSKFTFIAMIANQIIYYSDAFVIGYFLSAAAVTYYSISWTLAEYTKKVLMAISQTYAPAISEKDAVGHLDNIKDLYISGTRYMIIISNLLSIGVIVLGGAFIAIWMGPKYKELCETVLIILFVNQIIMGPQLLSYSILQGIARQKYYSYMSMAVSLVNLLLSIWFVQLWGIVGVALGAAIPQILFHGLFVPWLTLSTLKLSVRVYFEKTYLPSIVPSIALFICLYLVSVYFYPDGYIKLLFSAFVCATVYAVFAYFLMLEKSEKTAAKYFLARKLNRIAQS